MDQKYLWELTQEQKEKIATLVQQEIAREAAKAIVYERVTDYLNARPQAAETPALPFVETIAESLDNEWRNVQGRRTEEACAI